MWSKVWGLLVLATLPACAQIEMDSPSLSTSSTTVAPGVLQWESGGLVWVPRGRLERAGRSRFQRENLEDGDGTYFSAPNLFRLGLSDNLELRLESETLAVQGSRSGLSDISLGLKWNCWKSDDFSLALVGAVTPPSGKVPFRTNTFTPALTVAADWKTTADQSLTVNYGLSWVERTGQSDRFFQSFAAACYNVELCERWNAYAELAVTGPDDSRNDYETNADVGIGYRPTPNGQINLAYFRGLSSFGLDWGLSLGFGLRL